MVTSSDVSEYVQQERSSPLHNQVHLPPTSPSLPSPSIPSPSIPATSPSYAATSPSYAAYSPTLTRTSTNTTLSPDSICPEVSR